MADPQTRHGRGLLVVIFLALIFFALLAMIILRSGGEKEARQVASETMTVLPMRLRVRTEPNARAPVVTALSGGDHVTLLQDRGAWVRIRTSDGLTGWAERSALEKTVERERRTARHAAIRRLPTLVGSVTERAPLYAGPGIFYPIVGEATEGGNVTVYTRDHDFYAIEYGTGIAWAGVDAIDITSSGAQLEVGSSLPAGGETERTDTALAEQPQPEESPAPEPMAEPETAELAPLGGVFRTVPAGGTQPEEIDRAVPRYPMRARNAGVEGTVVVRGIVRRDGTIDNLEVIKDLPHSLGDEARRAVARWRFRPATFQGEPIDVYYTVTVNFRLR